MQKAEAVERIKHGALISPAGSAVLFTKISAAVM